MPDSLSLNNINPNTIDIDISGGGSGVTLPQATTTTAGLISSSDQAKINNLDYTYIKQGGNPIAGNLILGMSGSYGYIFQSGGTTVATLDSGGSFAASSVKNIGGSAFAYIGLTSSGTTISRSVADANPVLLVNQLNVSSTGNTLTVQKSGTDQLTLSSSGVLKVADLAGTGTRMVTSDSTGTLSSTTALTVDAMDNVVISNNIEVSGSVTGIPGMGPLILYAAPGVKISSSTYGLGVNTTYLTADRAVQIPDASGTAAAIGTTAPSSATDTGVVGEIRVTSSYVYVCIATDTWVRAPFVTF